MILLLLAQTTNVQAFAVCVSVFVCGCVRAVTAR